MSGETKQDIISVKRVVLMMVTINSTDYLNLLTNGLFFVETAVEC